MDEADVETLRGLYGEWARGDFRRVDVFAPDVEFVYSADFPEPAVHRGREGMMAAWADWLKEWDGVRVSADEFIDAGDQILVGVTISGRGKGSGAPLAEPGANLWRFRDGLAVRLELFADREGARRTLGLDNG